MWGVSHYGKNHPRPVGCHWASYLSYFSAALISCLSSPAAVQDVNIVQSISLSVSDSSVYWQLYSMSADVHGTASDVSSIYQRMDGIEQSVDGVSYNLLQIKNLIDSVIVEQDNYLLTRDTQVADKLDTLIDTNQYYLAAILDALRRSTDTNFLLQSSLWAAGSLFRNMNQDPLSRYTTALNDLLAHVDDPDYLYKMYGLWQYGPMEILFNYDWYSLDGAGKTPTVYDSGSEADVYYKFSQQFLGFPTKSKEYPWLANNTSPMGKLKMKYYGTYHITDALTNTVLTVDSNGHTITNKALLDQILSPGQYQALYRDNISQFTNGVVPVLGNAVDANTNGMFIGSYASPTNADMLASITTNDYVNSDYDSIIGDLNEANLNDKLDKAGFVDFDSKLEDVFSDTLTALEGANGNTWVIRLGNVSLGDWSYTIPDITVYRSESWFSLMRKFFEALKAICIIAFFLFLWNKLREAAAETS